MVCCCEESLPKTHCQRNDIRRTAGKPTAVHTALAADGNNAVAYQGRCNRRRSLMQKIARSAVGRPLSGNLFRILCG